MIRALRVFALLIPLAVVAGIREAGAEESAVDNTESASQLSRASASPVEHDGELFQLAASSSAANIDTDEYTTAGESLEAWKQLVTIQRVTLTGSTTPGDFLSIFRQRLAADGASFDPIRETAAATVFVVRFPQSQGNDEQVMVCLAFSDRANPAVLNIVQYAIKPGLIPVPLIERRIRSWRDRFVAQADALLAPGVP